jgi:hypothetical protein
MTRRDQLTDNDRRRIALAVHEAGHAVVGALYGATIERAALDDDGADGECEFAADTFGSTARAHRPLIAAAGAVAAAVFDHGPRPTLRQIEAHLEGSDREELRLASLSSVESPTAPLTDVLPVVLRCWPAIGEVATALALGEEITHADVSAALGLTDCGGPGSFELALIRSGSAPGAFTVTRTAIKGTG